MLKTSWHQGRSLVIQAKPDADPDMTVGELFRTGPVRLQVTTDEDLCAVLEVLLPEVLEATSEQSVADCHSEQRQADLFADELDKFDRFLQEETVRVKLEASTIEDLRAERAGAANTESQNAPDERSDGGAV